MPRFDQDWSPILTAMRAGNFFVTSGEVLIRNFAVAGAGPQRTITAEIEWTFPLEFVEMVWGDGAATQRQIIPATDRLPFGSDRFRIPLDAAGSGAFTQPVHLK